jgi:acetyl esterase/lipase
MRHGVSGLLCLFLALLLLPLLFVLLRAAAPTPSAPPAQPEEGPGGKRHAHAAVTKNRYGEGAREYWIYEPDAPRPRTAPLIVFLHGWGGTNPLVYGAWLDHLVKRGNIVIYPRYQADLRTPPRDFTPNALQAVREAIRRLQTEPGHVQPDLSRFAVVGHSVGGLLAANLAALARENGLPPARAIMSVEPGRTWNPLPAANVPLEDLKKIPADTLLLAVAGDHDKLARAADAKRVFYEAANVPAKNRNYVLLVSDAHGSPALNADHFAPCALDRSYDNGEPWGGQSAGRAGRNGPLRERLRSRLLNRVRQNEQNGPAGGGEPESVFPAGARADNEQAVIPRANQSAPDVNALDYYGLWKLFDGLTDAAFYGKNREYALGNTPQQRFMGRWSDGVKVKELVVRGRP